MARPYVYMYLIFAAYQIGTYGKGDVKIIENRGKLFFYENMHEIQFSMNLSAIVENAQYIHQNIDNLKNMCNSSLESSNCDYFLKRLQYNKRMINRDINFLRTHKSKKKRDLALAAAGWMMGTAVFASSKKSELLKERDFSLKRLDHLEKQLKVMEGTIETTRESVLDILNVIKQHELKIRELEESINRVTHFYDLLHLTSTMLEDHRLYMQKLENFWNNSILDQLFTLVEVSEFKDQLDFINGTLNEGYMLPNLTSFEILNVAKTSLHQNESHVTVTVKLPILKTEYLMLNEFFPVPVTRDNKTVLLDLDREYFVFNKDIEVLILPSSIFDDCCSFMDLTICNSWLYDAFETPNNCVKSLLLENNDRFCAHKTIEHKNYLIRTSDKSIYAYIVEPLLFKISCAGKNKIIEVKKSELITFPEECEIFKHTDSTISNTSLMSVEVDTPFFRFEVKTFNSTEEKWHTNIDIIEKDDLKFIELLNDTKSLWSYINKTKEEIITEVEASSFISRVFEPFINIWEEVSGLFGGFTKILITFIFKYLILPLLIMYFLLVFIKVCFAKLTSR